MATSQLISFRRREIEALRRQMGEDAICPSGKEAIKKRLRASKRRLKALLDNE